MKTTKNTEKSSAEIESPSAEISPQVPEDNIFLVW